MHKELGLIHSVAHTQKITTKKQKPLDHRAQVSFVRTFARANCRFWGSLQPPTLCYIPACFPHLPHPAVDYNAKPHFCGFFQGLVRWEQAYLCCWKDLDLGASSNTCYSLEQVTLSIQAFIFASVEGLSIPTWQLACRSDAMCEKYLTQHLACTQSMIAALMEASHIVDQIQCLKYS